MMAMIRRYGQFPAVFVPDEGEVVLAARSTAGPFLRAAVTSVRRSADDYIRIDFVWLEGSPSSASGTGHAVGDKGNVYIRRDDTIPLIRRVPVSRN